jgi:hypothetical protein
MKWFGVLITSAIMGIFLAVVAQAAVPWLTQEGFVLAAIVATGLIFVIMARLALVAGTIEVHTSGEWHVPN